MAKTGVVEQIVFGQAVGHEYVVQAGDDLRDELFLLVARFAGAHVGAGL
jgi:hypothetical protein